MGTQEILKKFVREDGTIGYILTNEEVADTLADIPELAEIAHDSNPVELVIPAKGE
jgi:hypothetical protein